MEERIEKEEEVTRAGGDQSRPDGDDEAVLRIGELNCCIVRTWHTAAIKRVLRLHGYGSGYTILKGLTIEPLSVASWHNMGKWELWP